MKSFFLSTVSAAAIALGGTTIALAAGSGAASGDPNQQQSQQQSQYERGTTGGASGSSGAGSQAQGGMAADPSQPGSGAESQAQGGLSADPAQPSQQLTAADLKGKEIKNAQGESIGEVKEVAGNDVIVGVGGFLGIGERNVAIPRDQLQVSGSGDNLELTTNMTKEQVEALPEHRSEGSGAAPSESPAGAGGGRY